MGHENAATERCSRLQYLLVKRVNHFRLSSFTAFITDSDTFTIPAV